LGDLSEKIVLVTGAANGVGKVIVDLFKREGAIVIASDVQFEELQEHCRSVADHCLSLDVSCEKDWLYVEKIIDDTYGRLDVLVNNAGIVSGEQVAEGTIEVWNKVMNVNGLGSYLGMKMAISLMKKNGCGSIVNISSIVALIGTGGGTTYHASKGAIRAMSKRVATHYGKDKIRVNTIFPGWIETNMTKDARSEKVADFKNRQALPYFGKPEDVAEAALFLACDKSKFVTGAELIVDGGYTIN